MGKKKQVQNYGPLSERKMACAGAAQRCRQGLGHAVTNVMWTLIVLDTGLLLFCLILLFLSVSNGLPGLQITYCPQTLSHTNPHLLPKFPTFTPKSFHYVLLFNSQLVMNSCKSSIPFLNLPSISALTGTKLYLGDPTLLIARPSEGTSHIPSTSRLAGGLEVRLASITPSRP